MDDLSDNGSPVFPADFIDGVVVRRADGRDRAEDWALVLSALGITHRAERQDDGTFAVVVPSAESPAALRALDANDDELRAGAAVAPSAPDRGNGWLGVAVAAALLAFQFVTGVWERQPPTPWFAVGVADARLIVAGEWWRAVTAMTLHADFMHLFGNAAASVIFVGTASRWLGAGVAAALILLAGAGANVTTAFVQKHDHLSVGASTATFAALGLVVGLQVVRRWRGGGAVRRRAWVAAGAGLALLAMLGVGARSDVFAHAFGLGYGVLAGVGAGVVDRPQPISAARPAMGETGPPRLGGSRGGGGGASLHLLWQGGLGLAALAAVIACWARAFGRL